MKTVRDMTKMIETDLWEAVAHIKTHDRYTHHSKSGRITMPVKLNLNLSQGAVDSVFWQSEMADNSHKPAEASPGAPVIEQAGDNYSAYVPGLLGCVAVGDTEKECKDGIKL